MVLIVETGAGLTNSNSYADVAFADAYFAGHPFYADSWADLEVGTKEFLLESATRDIDSLINWKGSPSSTTQALRWPRVGATNVDAIPYARNVIPIPVRQAICEQARYLSTAEGNPDAPSDTAGVTELRVDVITLKFGQSEARKAVPRAALRLLSGLGTAYSSSRIGRVQVRL
jgi:hypothetical protein